MDAILNICSSHEMHESIFCQVGFCFFFFCLPGKMTYNKLRTLNSGMTLKRGLTKHNCWLQRTNKNCFQMVEYGQFGDTYLVRRRSKAIAHVSYLNSQARIWSIAWFFFLLLCLHFLKCLVKCCFRDTYKKCL